jgi:hypothetical protein
MTTYDMKSIAANTSGPSDNRSVIFGADNQGAATPVPYDFGAMRSKVVGLLYAANRWYLPFGVTGAGTGGALNAANAIYLFPGFIVQKCTLSALGCRISGTPAVGNIQLAVYANGSAMRPTGNALASTASISTNSANTSINAAVSVQLDVGWYWFGANIDNTTATINTVSNALAPGIIGAATQSNILNNGAGWGISVAQTFGTWPDLTSASFTEGFPATPAVQFKVGSVP